MLIVISKALAAALTAIALWGGSVAWDQASTIHNHLHYGYGGCHEVNPSGGGPNYLHEAMIGVGLALVMPKRWKGPAVTIWFGSSALVHAQGALHNQALNPTCVTH
jgi:hypothetical protein